MSIATFSSPALAITPNHSTLPENCRRAILAIEGEHVDDRGRSHSMDAAYIETLGLNTNKQIALGRIVNAFENHRIDSSAKFGSVMGTLDVRRVSKADLPYPEATGMIGKMAIFGVMKFNRLLDKVKSGAIKALSPGIDLSKQIIIEVSEVPVAAMPGVALFRHSGLGGKRTEGGKRHLSSSAFFSYAQLKEQDSKFSELRDRAIGFLDLYLKFCSIEEARKDPDGVIEVNKVSPLRVESFWQLTDDLRQVFNIPDPDEKSTQIDGVTYSKNPYDRQIVKSNFAMGEWVTGRGGMRYRKQSSSQPKIETTPKPAPTTSPNPSVAGNPPSTEPVKTQKVVVVNGQNGSFTRTQTVNVTPRTKGFGKGKMALAGIGLASAGIAYYLLNRDK